VTGPFWDEQKDEEDHLIDLDPAEGKRRGGELMSMLFEKPGGGPPDAALPITRSTCGLLPPRGPPAHVGQAWGSSIVPSLPVAFAGSIRGAAAGVAFAPPAGSSEQRCSRGDGPVGVRQPVISTAAVCEAARRAFGPDAVNVTRTPSGGFGIELLGAGAAVAAAAAAGRIEERRMAHQLTLDALGRALWPLLGQEAVGMEWRSGLGASTSAEEASQSVSGSGHDIQGCSMSAGSSLRLTIWCLSEDDDYTEDLCWDFARRGACPRGGRCQWLHVLPHTYPVDLEVL